MLVSFQHLRVIYVVDLTFSCEKGLFTNTLTVMNSGPNQPLRCRRNGSGEYCADGMQLARLTASLPEPEYLGLLSHQLTINSLNPLT
jgi:hypothetical protein